MQVITLTPSNLLDGILVPGVVAVDSTPEQVQVTQTFIYRIAGIRYDKAPTTGIAMVASKTINVGLAAGQFWGVFLIQINAAGTVTMKAPSNDQVHASEAAAIAAKAKAMVRRAPNRLPARPQISAVNRSALAADTSRPPARLPSPVTTIRIGA